VLFSSSAPSPADWIPPLPPVQGGNLMVGPFRTAAVDERGWRAGRMREADAVERPRGYIQVGMRGNVALLGSVSRRGPSKARGVGLGPVTSLTTFATFRSHPAPPLLRRGLWGPAAACLLACLLACCCSSAAASCCCCCCCCYLVPATCCV